VVPPRSPLDTGGWDAYHDHSIVTTEDWDRFKDAALEAIARDRLESHGIAYRA
jgi:hypothetical protein